MGCLSPRRSPQSRPSQACPLKTCAGAPGLGILTDVDAMSLTAAVLQASGPRPEGPPRSCEPMGQQNCV